MIFLILFLYVIAVFGAQYIVGWLVRFLNKKITATAEEIENNNLYKDTGIKKEVAGLRAVDAKKERLGFITRIVGITEFLVFSALALLMSHDHPDLLYVTDFLLKLVGGWLAIKTLGNYRQWSGVIFGRASFYTFLIGSLLNIILAILFGIGINALLGSSIFPTQQNIQTISLVITTIATCFIAWGALYIGNIQAGISKRDIELKDFTEVFLINAGKVLRVFNASAFPIYVESYFFNNGVLISVDGSSIPNNPNSWYQISIPEDIQALGNFTLKLVYENYQGIRYENVTTGIFQDGWWNITTHRSTLVV